MMAKEKRNASAQLKVDFFQKISENIRPLKNKKDRSIDTKLRYLDIWDDNPIKLYAMVQVKNDQELLYFSPCLLPLSKKINQQFQRLRKKLMSFWKSLMNKFQKKSKIAEVPNIIVKVIHNSCRQDSRCEYRNFYSRPPELVMNQFQNIGAITSNGV
jgi:hypothetical protein